MSRRLATACLVALATLALPAQTPLTYPTTR